MTYAIPLIDYHYIIFFMSMSYILGIFFHHTLLYFHTKELSYLFFALYAFTLLFGILGITEFFRILWCEHADSDLVHFMIRTLSLQLYYIALILFTLHVIQIKSFAPKLYRFTLFLTFNLVLLNMMIALIQRNYIWTLLGAVIFLFIVLFLSLFSIYKQIDKSYQYILTTVPLFVGVLGYALPIDTLFGLTYNISHFVVLCAVLHVSFLSVFISLKIKILQDEKDRNLLKNAININTLHIQSRNASMGEITADIAHQWKQPLNALGSIQSGIIASLMFNNEMSKQEMLDVAQASVGLIQHLSETIDTFYGFLTQRNSNTNEFKIIEQFETIKKLTEYTLQNRNIKYDFVFESDPVIVGNPNEFIHALLNIILNAKEALEHSSVSSPMISIYLSEENDTCKIIVKDNAGGIKIDPPDSIFKRYVSTKMGGSGLGLYMSKEIVTSRFGGEITVENSVNGACFTIILPHNRKSLSMPSYDTDLQEIKKLAYKVLKLEKAEQELNQWIDIFEQVNWGMAIYYPNMYKFKTINKVFSDLYGYSFDELENMTFYDLFASDALHYEQKLKNMVNSNGYAKVAVKHKHKDGSIFSVLIEIIVVKDSNQTPVYLIANIWDKTEELHNKDYVQRLGVALDITQEAVYLMDINGCFLYVNNGACAMLDYTKEEFSTMCVMDIDPTHTKEQQDEIAKNPALAVNQYAFFETVHVAKDGRQIPVEITAMLVSSEQKHYDVVATVRDISVRKKNEKALYDSEERIRTMADNIPGFIFTYKRDKTGVGSFIFVGRRVMDVYGVQPEEVMESKNKLRESVYPEDLVKFNSAIDVSAQTLTPFFAEFRVKHPLKGQLSLETRAIPKALEDGSVVWHGITFDVTQSSARKIYLDYINLAMSRINEGIILSVEDEKGIRRFTFVNHKAANMLGYTPEEMIGLTPFDINPYLQDKDLQPTTNGPKVLKTAHLHKNGTLIPVEVNLESFDFEGQQICIALIQDFS